MAATITLKLYEITCCECFMTFAVPDEYNDKCRKDHRTFYCPAGHPQSYQYETEAEKLRRQLNEANAKAARESAAHDQTKAALRQKEHEKQLALEAKSKLEKRIKNGVCPCCGRTFSQLVRHLKAKHPEYVEKSGIAPASPVKTK